METSRHTPLLNDEPTPAAATQLLDELGQQAIIYMEPTLDMYQAPVTIPIPMNNLPTLGLLVKEDQSTETIIVTGCQEGTQISRSPKWRSTIRNSIIRTVDNVRVRTRKHLTQRVKDARERKATHVTVKFTKLAVTQHGNEDEIPQLHFDQLRHINKLHMALRNLDHDAVDAFLNYTRAQLRKRPDYQQWRESEWQQHDKYFLQNMFGDPILCPDGAIVLPFVWTYILKEDPITGEMKAKLRATCCNGGKKYGKAVTLAETYATCVEQPACRLYWSLVAALCLLAMGADAGNAFAEAPPATQIFYMRIDDQFREWWVEHMHRPPIPPGYVLPVNHALQGHPEAPRLWEKHIHGILTTKLHFTPTTHEQCIYSRRSPDALDEVEMILRQVVDDFSVAAATKEKCTAIINSIGGEHLTVVPLNNLGIIRKCNGVNILQTRHYVKISCEDYLLKILLNHQ